LIHLFLTTSITTLTYEKACTPIFLFVNSDTQNTGLNLEMLKTKERMIPDVVHPSKIEDPTFGFCLDVMKKYIRRKANELTR